MAAHRLDVNQGSPLATVLFDNLTRGQDGRIWRGFSVQRSPKVDATVGQPFLRALTLRLPRALGPVPTPHGM